MFQFGVGYLFANPTGGNLAVNPTPQQFGTLQDVSLEITQDLKELRGNLKFPDDVAPGNMKISGKAGAGRLEVDLFNQLFFADSVSAGIKVIQAVEAQTVNIATNTATVTHAAGFFQDEGVWYLNPPAGFRKDLDKVASAPAQGQYAVNAATGIYTFASADSGAQTLISYVYNPSPNTAGRTITVNNQLLGYGPTTELWLAQPYQGTNGIHLYAVRFAKLGIPLKREDYQIADLEFQGFANASGQVIDFFQVTQ